MADIFSTASAAASLLGQCIDLYVMVRRAADRYKNRTDLIDSYIAKVKKTKATIELVRSESALQTPSVEASLKQIVSISESLKKYLEGINVTGGPIKGFLKHLVSGDEIQGHLDKTMKDLEAAKLSLSLSIQVTNVGLVREVGEAVRVSVSTVSTMSQLIQDKLGPGCVLRMSQLIEGRASVGEFVTLTKEDIAVLATPIQPVSGTGRVDSRARSESVRIVSNNEALSSALQINTPIGVDVWKDVGHVTITGNKASHSAIQINAGVNSESFLAILNLVGQRKE